MRNNRDRRIAALEKLTEPSPLSAADLAMYAALEALASSHGYLLSPSVVEQIESPNVRMTAAGVCNFLDAVEAVDPDAAAEFWKTFEFFEEFKASKAT